MNLPIPSDTESAFLYQASFSQSWTDQCWGWCREGRSCRSSERGPRMCPWAWHPRHHGQPRSCCGLHEGFPRASQQSWPVHCSCTFAADGLKKNIKGNSYIPSSWHCTWLEGSDVETGLVVPDGKEVIESVMGQRLHGGGGAVPSRLQSLLVWIYRNSTWKQTINVTYHLRSAWPMPVFDCRENYLRFPKIFQS